MKLIKIIIRFFTTTTIDKPFSVLGRWQIEKCNAKLNYKIDLSNRDHSGNCDEYIIKHHIKYRDIKNNSNKSSLKI